MPSTDPRVALPPLPFPARGGIDIDPMFTEDQMHDYARTALSLALGDEKPVAWRLEELPKKLNGKGRWFFEEDDPETRYTKDWLAEYKITPLYASPQRVEPAPLSEDQVSSCSLCGGSRTLGSEYVESCPSCSLGAVASSVRPDGMPTSADERHLRRMLCAVCCGPLAYMDDGEASDASVLPVIDFMREPAIVIDSKLRERGLRKLAEQRRASAGAAVQDATQTSEQDNQKGGERVDAPVRLEDAPLPPLPEPAQISFVQDSTMRTYKVLSYTERQMHDYALAARRTSEPEGMDSGASRSMTSRNEGGSQ